MEVVGMRRDMMEYAGIGRINAWISLRPKIELFFCHDRRKISADFNFTPIEIKR